VSGMWLELEQTRLLQPLGEIPPMQLARGAAGSVRLLMATAATSLSVSCVQFARSTTGDESTQIRPAKLQLISN
jgi:hypothetical protein